MFDEREETLAEIIGKYPWAQQCSYDVLLGWVVNQRKFKQCCQKLMQQNKAEEETLQDRQPSQRQYIGEGSGPYILRRQI